MNPIVFLDTETTGLHPKREAWEIAMIRRDDSGQHELSFFVHDLRLDKADPFALKIGRFYERHPNIRGEHHIVGSSADGESIVGDDCVYKWNAAELVERWTRGAFIVGAVPNFDTETLARLLRRNGFLPAWHYHLRDVEAMAVGYLAGLGMEELGLGRDWKSDDLSRACGVEPPNDDERHTAMGDARWAMRWYDAITKGDAP